VTYKASYFPLRIILSNNLLWNPDSIALNDVGVSVGITVFTSNAKYYVETSVAPQ
jgi:hypothetical protein